MLLGVCKGPSYENASHVLKKMQALVDGVELRLDLFSEIDIAKLKELLKNWNKKVLFTFRKNSQGGKFQRTDKQQEEAWEKLLSLEPNFVDIEYDAPEALYQMIKKNYPKIQILCSYHDFEKTPLKIEDIAAIMKMRPFDIIKIATKARSSLDSLKMLLWVKASSERNEKIIGLCMGDEGKITRILSPVVGNFINYASFEDEATAPGQLSIEELFTVYNYKELKKNTKVFGVIGYPVEKSLGPIAHNAVMKRLNRNGIYIKIPIQKEELSAFFTYVKKLGFFGGLSVTMPLKEDVFSYIDEIDPEAETIGAINTIIYNTGISTGYNTDGKAAIKALEQKTPLSEKTVIIVGSGGAAKAIVLAAVKKKANVKILNRTKKKALELGKRFRCEAGPLTKLSDIAKLGYDVIINTTPDDMPIEEDLIITGCIAMDIKTRPILTTFLQKAAQRDCLLIYGHEMFTSQAAMQQDLWFTNTDEKFDIEQMIKEAIRYC